MSKRSDNPELVIAIPKGFLHDETHEYLLSRGIDLSDRKSSRDLVFYDRRNNIKGILVRPSDVNVYVEHGSADIGIVGLDLLKEQEPDVVKLKDLGFGTCTVVLAVRKDTGYKSPKDLPPNCKIATKFTKIASEYIQKKGILAEIIKLYGSIELGPITGLSDAIIDLVATGKTLKANNLVAIDKNFVSNAFLVANPVSYKIKRKIIRKYFDY